MLIMLLLLCVAVHVFSRYTGLVESLYSNGFYRAYSKILRTLTGLVPFSIGDIIYGLLFMWIIWKVILWVRNLRNRRAKVTSAKGGLIYKTLIILSVVYLIFNISWGINYNRKGIATQLGIKVEKYSVPELKELNCMLSEKVVASKKALDYKKNVYPGSRQLFQKVSLAYREAGKKYVFLNYHPPSMKSSLWAWAGNYMGFTGYYNPFTGEAQVNTTVPKFLQPFIACHEAAHQAGYAKEQEANFVGYLVGSNSADTLLQYSVYLDLFVYANRNLYRTDSNAAKLYVQDLDPAVLNDLREWRKFNLHHKSFLEPAFRLLYGLFLRGNQQPQGLLSYDEVTGFMIAYYKKFGTI